MELAPEGNTRRLDSVLVERGLQPSRERAKEAILSGQVSVNGKIAGKPSQLIAGKRPGGLQSTAASLCGAGRRKAGKSAAYFRDGRTRRARVGCRRFHRRIHRLPLQHGAAEVFAVDVGQGQLHPSLRRDARVRFLEKTDIRDTRRISEWLQGRRPDFCAVDVSFISLEQVGNAVLALLAPQAWVVWLVKPQFEAGRSAVGKKGVVRYREDHVRVLENAWPFFSLSGLPYWMAHSLPITGGEGNIELFEGHCKKRRRRGRTAGYPFGGGRCLRELRHTN